MAKQKAASGKDNPHPVDVYVGQRVKLRRMAMGLSQEKLGKAMELTFQQIQKYEKGANRISASKLYELGQELEVPIQFFYDGYGPEPHYAGGFAETENEDPFMELIQSPEGVQLCRYFASIKDPDVKKRVLDLVKSIAETEGAGKSA
ncbi:helix-turn-helix domain-containing protein [Hyphococcus sp.]|uniref:helix-turn-helix domain-containing protein n=1 Tax=Hyphococcus sp. TaxID=2038636 RepID=UPI003CCBDDD9